MKALDEKIQKYQQKVNKRQERIDVIEGRLKSDNTPAASIDSLRAQHNELTDIVNKLQSQVDEMKRSDKPKVVKKPLDTCPNH
jgi:chromosome segregation ATPase